MLFRFTSILILLMHFGLSSSQAFGLDLECEQSIRQMISTPILGPPTKNLAFLNESSGAHFDLKLLRRPNSNLISIYFFDGQPHESILELGPDLRIEKFYRKEKNLVHGQREIFRCYESSACANYLKADALKLELKSQLMLEPSMRKAMRCLVQYENSVVVEIETNLQKVKALAP